MIGVLYGAGRESPTEERNRPKPRMVALTVLDPSFPRIADRILGSLQGWELEL